MLLEQIHRNAGAATSPLSVDDVMSSVVTALAQLYPRAVLEAVHITTARSEMTDLANDIDIVSGAISGLFPTLSVGCITQVLVTAAQQRFDLFAKILADLSTQASHLTGHKAKHAVVLAVTFVEHLFATNTHTISDLCHSKDAQDREVIQFVPKEVREVLNKHLFFCGRYELTSGAPIHCSATAVVVACNDYGCVNDYEKVFSSALKTAVTTSTTASSIATNISSSSNDELDFKLFVNAVRQVCDNLGVSAAIDTELQSKYDAYADTCGINLRDFLKFCVTEYGPSRKVVIKFMRVEEQFKREVSTRELGGLNKKYVLTFLKGPDPIEFERQVKSLYAHDGKLSLADFKYGLIMPAADRSLDAIFRAERPDIQQVRAIMYEVCRCVRHLHQRGIVHGDLKMLNILRVDGNIRLIDMDAACRMNTDCVGNKFSSGMRCY